MVHHGDVAVRREVLAVKMCLQIDATQIDAAPPDEGTAPCGLKIHHHGVEVGYQAACVLGQHTRLADAGNRGEIDN